VDKIDRYIGFIRSDHPKRAAADRIEEASHEGEVMAASEFLQTLQFEQIDKENPSVVSIDKK
jgi:hypothetical protein